MKINLRIVKNDASLYAGSYDVIDAESFGQACADAWGKLQQEQFDQETSIGALMDHLDRAVIDQLLGAQIHIDKA
jgi:hypothetical protein